MTFWEDIKHFEAHEFKCRHTGKNRMRPEFVRLLDEIRHVYNRPIVVSSGYRHKTHPIEAAKDEPGEHFYGVAADIYCSGTDYLELQHIAFEHGIRRIGVSQTGDHDSRFIHLGIGDRELGFPPGGWSY